MKHVKTLGCLTKNATVAVCSQTTIAIAALFYE